MKKFLFLAVALSGILSCAFAQTGTWSGDISIQGMKLRVVFHLEDENPTLDVPDQNAKGIPISFSRTEDGKVKIDIIAIGASYEGTLLDGRIAGTFTQMGMPFPLDLMPGIRKLNRPQTPVGPFPYAQEEVSFSNGDALLKGTLVLPENCSRETLALVMVTGSGQQNRDEEIFEHKPFAVIADALGRAGYATLRFDDRGFGESTGDAANATTDDLKEDALAGIRLLRERFDSVGVIGHSEGGTIALMLAAEGQADFIVSLSGMAVSGDETLVWQTSLALAAAGVPQDDIENYSRLLQECYAALRSGEAVPSPEGRNLTEQLKQSYLALQSVLKSPYFKRFISLDMRPLLGSIKCPVLALNGSKDLQVEPERNLGALREGLKGNPDVRIEQLEGLNHLFQHSETGLVTEYREIEETFAPEVLGIILQWLDQLK